MEMASTREHRTVRRSFLNTVTLLDSLGTDGRWKCHEFYWEQSESESIQPRRCYTVLRIMYY